MSFADLVAHGARRQLAAFGEVVTYTPTVGAPPPAAATPLGIFDQQYVLATGTAEAGVETLGPAVFLLLADLPTDPEVDKPTITIRSVVYRVYERKPDGMGGIVLMLRRVV